MNKKNIKVALLLISFGVILFVALQNINVLLDILFVIISLVMPLILGVVIAFVLNLLLKTIEKKLLYKIPDRKIKLKRALSLSMTLIIVIGFIIFLLFLIIPELKNAIKIFIDNIPIYQEQIIDLAKKLNIPSETIDSLKNSIHSLWESLLVLFKNNSKDFVEATLGATTSIVSSIANFFLGFVFAIYMLADKEHLIRQVKKVINAILPKKKVGELYEIAKVSDNVFSKFITGQLTEAIIIGILCFIGMLILKLPYASSISVLVGFTALIPVFGAFIGTIIGAILIFVVDPLGALVFIIYIIVLQQFEGNLIYPKVVGTSVGLPGMWVMFAVLIGGALFGIIGMLIGVPICSIIYILSRKYVNKRLKLKGEIELIDFPKKEVKKNKKIVQKINKKD